MPSREKAQGFRAMQRVFSARDISAEKTSGLAVLACVATFANGVDRDNGGNKAVAAQVPRQSTKRLSAQERKNPGAIRGRSGGADGGAAALVKCKECGRLADPRRRWCESCGNTDL